MNATDFSGPQVSRSASGVAIYVPAFAEAPAAMVQARLQLVVGERSDLVRLIPPDRAFPPAEPPAEDRLVLALEPQLFDRRLVTAIPQESRDPYLYGMGHAILCGFRVGRAPTERYLESVVGHITRHVRENYPLPRRRRERKGLSPSRLARALGLIDERLADPLAVESLAQAVHLSPFHFARMFRRSTDCSPHEFITRRRLEKAKELLAAGDLTLAEIARTVGYRTQAHFTRVFHEGTGTTPRRYRLAHRASR